VNIRISGRLYDGVSATSTPVKAVCDGSGWLSIENVDFGAITIADIQFSERVGTIPRTMQFPNGKMFECDDNDSIDRWLIECGHHTSWQHHLERNGSFAAAALVALALVILVAVRWGIPQISNLIAARLPTEVDAMIATGTLEALDETVFEKSKLSELEQRPVLEIFNTLESYNHEVNFNLVFRGGGWIGPNAFALPNGTIIVTDELIALSRHEDELGSVLLHEMGHVVHRHSLRQVIRHSWLAMLSLLIVGDVSSAGTLVLALPSILVQSAYSQEFETEADDFALARMREHNLDPTHFANFLDRIERCAAFAGDAISECDGSATINREDATHQPSGWLRYLSTHPTNERRTARFRRPKD
jgi:Zn-dependent protease with chaperone function